MRTYSFSRTGSLSTLESSNPLMRRAGSRITAAKTTGPASGAQPASSTPARSGMSGQRRSVRRGEVATSQRSSITKVMQVSEHPCAVGIAQCRIPTIEVEAVAPVAQQRVGDEERIARNVGRVQQQ